MFNRLIFKRIFMEQKEIFKKPISKDVDKVANSIVDAAYTVHKTLGPGLLESVYEICLVYELRERGHFVESQIALPVQYKTIRLDTGLKLDLLVDNCIIIELKTVSEILPIHQAQLLSYLKLTGLKVGFVINFKTQLIKDGIRRFAF
jgi:GxxExxY protein